MTFKEKHNRYGYLALVVKADSERVQKALVEEYDCKICKGRHLLKYLLRLASVPYFLRPFVKDEILFKAPNAIVGGQAIKDIGERLNWIWNVFDPYGYVR